jgi:hypothetical protein
VAEAGRSISRTEEGEGGRRRRKERRKEEGAGESECKHAGQDAGQDAGRQADHKRGLWRRRVIGVASGQRSNAAIAAASSSHTM